MIRCVSSALLLAAVSAPAAAATLSVIYDTATEPTRTVLQRPVPVAYGAVIGQSAGFGDNGQVYVLTPGKAGQPYAKTLIHAWNPATRDSDGASPSGNLVADKAGNLWGTTDSRGANAAGTLFELTKPASKGAPWGYRVVLQMPAKLAPTVGQGTLIFDPAGNLYGLAIDGTQANGCYPGDCNRIWELPAAMLAGGADRSRILLATPAKAVALGMVRDGLGNFYGVESVNTYAGDAWEAVRAQNGSYAFQVLHVFCSIRNASNQCVDGYAPTGLVTGAPGSNTLYGLTYVDGTDPGITNCCSAGVGGVAFSLTRTGSAWNFAVVHNFLFHTTDGSATPDNYVEYGIGLTRTRTGALLLSMTDGGLAQAKDGPYEGGLVSVDPATGADSVFGQGFAVRSGPDTAAGPVAPQYAPVLDAAGNTYGASGGFFTPAAGLTSNGVYYRIKP